MARMTVSRASVVGSLLALPIVAGLSARTGKAARRESAQPTPPGLVPADTPAVRRGHASISGEVRARGVGLAVPGAVVTVLGPGGRVEARKQSDSRGAFLFKGLSAGMYTVRAEAPGFVRAVQSQVLVRGGRAVRITLSLDPKPLTIPKLQVEAQRRDKAFIQHQIGMNLNSLNPSDIAIGSRLQKVKPSSIHFTDLLRKLAIPGLLVIRNPSGQGFCVQVDGVVDDIGRPLCAAIYLDGVAVESDLQLWSLNQDVMDIGAVVLLHADQAGTLYGTGAMGGALLVYTRDGMGLRPK